MKSRMKDSYRKGAATHPDLESWVCGREADAKRRQRPWWAGYWFHISGTGAIAHVYHQPADVVRPDWDMSGAVQDLQFYGLIGYRVSMADKYPEWKAGSEFKGVREEQLKAAAAR